MTTSSTYELWRDAGGTWSFFQRDNTKARARMTAQAELVWSVEAQSFEEALAAQKAYLGWGG
jgi:hypothetical protein